MLSIRRNLKCIYTIWLRDMTRFVRDRGRILWSLGGPMLYLFVLGGGLSPAMSDLGGGFIDFRQFVFPGVLSMTVLFTSVFSAVSIVWDREFGFLKEVMVAPVSRMAVALGKVAGGSTSALFQGMIVLLLAPLIGIKLTWDQILILMGLMLLLASVMTSLGILIAARQHSVEGFQLLMQFVLLPMYFLSGALFPIQGVPLWMEWLNRFDPVSYGVDSMRQIALRETVPAQFLSQLSLHPIALDVAIILGFGVLFIVPAVWLFSRQD